MKLTLYLGQGPGGFGGGTGGPGGFPGGFDPNDIFSQFFGGGFGGRASAGPGGVGGDPFRNVAGEDIQTPLTISFMDAAKGATKYVTVDKIVDCPPCKGTGVKAGKSRDTCKTCGGSGVQTILVGGFHMQTTCGTCGGSGSAIPPGAGCNSCNGIGRVREQKTIQVNIPPGVDNNSRIRVAGEGDAPMKGSGPRGDLFVSLNVSILDCHSGPLKLSRYVLIQCQLDIAIQDLQTTGRRCVCERKDTIL